MSFPSIALITLLRLYQRTLSPDHGWFRPWAPFGFCRYAPSCSSYAILAIERYGALHGTLLASWRVLRCNPWSRGGLDPVA